jgi:hypothetical protein
MKIIITEEQYKLLTESNTEPMQSLIDMAFEAVKENCDGGYYIMAHHDYICNPIDMIEEIKVIGTSKGQVMDYSIKNKIDVIYITINFYIDSIYEYNNLDNFIYELQEEARNIVGGKFIIINQGKVINKRKNFDW